MQTDSFNTGSVLLWKGRRDAAAHRAALVALSRRREGAWIQLSSALLKTRYGLEAIELSFGDAETPKAIQASLQRLSQTLETKWHRDYLIAQPHAEAPCYNISDYVRKCVTGDLDIAERLRGRTVITLYQTAGTRADLFSDSGVFSICERWD